VSRPHRGEPGFQALQCGEGDPIMLDTVNEAMHLDSDLDIADSLKPARGIIYGVLLSLPLWAAVLATYRVAINLLNHL
jgi:hypothetical protein